MSPGINVRPPPSMTVDDASRAIDEAVTRSIMLPRISTFIGPETESPLPSKMRTFWNSVTGGLVDVAVSRVNVVCPALTPHSPRTATIRKNSLGNMRILHRLVHDAAGSSRLGTRMRRHEVAHSAS